ncbi:amino acid adenylation domain-containing protein [Streptomyces sp. NPDC006879]|uniref:amino acid adenylation domain-containing protein n=1 Tax=Streptomyces sp. NPDC006879 TaxID=3364767 RepID=UPI00368E852F
MGKSTAVGKCLTDLLTEQARARPNEIAVVCEAETLTFRELVDWSTDLASYLHHLGLKRDEAVGVFVDPAFELIAGTWGILYAGGAYLPLSPEYPDERLRYMIEDAQITVVFTQEELRERLTELTPEGIRIVTSEDVSEYKKKAPSDRGTELPPGPHPEDLAYVIYTSGSTGKPKGVMIEHRSIAHQMNWLADACGLGAGTVVLQKTPMSFDAAQWEILAVACGSRTVIGTAGIYRDPPRLIEAVIQHGVTALQCVPTLLQALLDSDELHRCTSLTQIFSGGEALSRTLARKCAAQLPRCTVTNLYGPTECTINTSAFTVDPAALDDGPQAVSIGAPVAGMRYYVLGPTGRPVGPGETGELHISGVQLARGYLHRPDLTAERFLDNPSGAPAPHHRLYRTGDLAQWNTDGTVQFAGRVDNQVKLRGFRIELDEIRLAIEAHDWVKNAAVLVRDDPHTGFQNLIACMELSPREAALMDQGTPGAHHLSKASKLQVKAQLANPGTREDNDLAHRPTLPLPGAEATSEQRRRAFARKTYRFYEGGAPQVQDLLDALGRPAPPARRPRAATTLSFDELGRLLREFGPHLSGDRLLPKYGYASPGSLYATQLYLEAHGFPGLAPGVHYYHPQRHQLVLVQPADPAVATVRPGLSLHFVGRTSAIEPVYKNNIREVLEIETGHMLGLLDEVLPGYGLTVTDLPHTPDLRARLGCAPEDHYLGSFALTPHGTAPTDSPVDVYVQLHPGGTSDLPAGQYRYRAGALERISEELVLKRHVIAINQQVYERAGFGITFVARNGVEGEVPHWRSYIDLGRALQHLQSNASGLGFMSAGYSSRSGHDLPAARRFRDILSQCELPAGPSYFCVGGPVSETQRDHQGMYEDTVHMKGPAEMIRDDLVGFLPEFMLPNRILVLDQLPQTANGKIDTKALEARVDAEIAQDERPVVAPRTRTETKVRDLWKAAMKREVVSVQDDFFACGGNSLIAVALVHRINRTFGVSLPVQVIFQSPTVEQLAARIDGDGCGPSSRLVPLRHGATAAPGAPHPVFCWPGLGGYAMNLRLLATRDPGERAFYGVQAHGLNSGEQPFTDLTEMARADLTALRRIQPAGPYTLWGYSFGARVAYEAAWLLEQAGEKVERLLLLAPGSPRIPDRAESWSTPGPDFADPTFVTILYSVFAGTTGGPLLAECLRVAVDEDSFARFVIQRFRGLDASLVRRIVRVVCTTYGWMPQPRALSAPVTLFKARGDEDSFLERTVPPETGAFDLIHLDTDHYGALRDPGVDELTKVIQRETS